MTHHEPESQLRRIVLGLDGSTGAHAAMRWCVEYAPALHAEVVAVFAFDPVISVIPSPVLPPPEMPVFDETTAADMADELRAWCSPLQEANVPFRTSVVRGSPSAALQCVADEEDAAMIVVGRRGRSGLSEMLLGSVPHDLTHRAARPVLVVPAL